MLDCLQDIQGYPSQDHTWANDGLRRLPPWRHLEMTKVNRISPKGTLGPGREFH
jgi:hypothetical protein